MNTKKNAKWFYPLQEEVTKKLKKRYIAYTHLEKFITENAVINTYLCRKDEYKWIELCIIIAKSPHREHVGYYKAYKKQVIF